MSDRSYKFSFLNQILTDSGPVLKILAVFILMVSSLLIFSFLGLLLAGQIFHIPIKQFTELLDGNLNNVDIPLLKYVQATQSLALFVIPSLILNYLIFKPGKGFVNTGKNPSFLLIVLAITTIIVSSPLINLLLEWNSLLKFPHSLAGLESKIQEYENNAAQLTERLLSGSHWISYFSNILIMAIIPAIGEEFLFRGVLQRIFAEWLRNVHVAIIIASVLFSSFHMQFYGFIPRFALGLFFGYLFYWRGNIWIAVLAHFFNNAVAITTLFLDKNYGSNISTRFELIQSNIPLMIACGVLTFFIISRIRKKYNINYILSSDRN